jgi:hypothetical protein
MLPEGLLPLQREAPGADEDPAHMQAANLCRQWGNLYLEWLKVSECRLLEKQYERPVPDKQQFPLVLFTKLQLPESPKCSLATTYEEARELFLKGNNYFMQATKHYLLDGYVSDHVKIVQDISQLYKHLSTYEPDLTRAIKFHKKRAGVIEPLVNELSPKHFLELYQQLTDETARIHQDIMETKLLTIAELPWNPKRVKGQLAANASGFLAIRYFDMWLKSFGPDFASMPKVIDAAYHQAFLGTVFTKARVWGKIFTLAVPELVVNLKQSLHCYMELERLHRTWEVAPDLFEQELVICREMIELLPSKINKIHSSGIPFQ